MAVEEEEVVDEVWDGEEVEEVEVLEVDPGAEEEQLGEAVVVEDSAVRKEEKERVEAMVAGSDLEHRQ
jgi:hypothetical protein